MHLRSTLVIAVAACAMAIPGSAVAVQRTFVASTGSDTNPCSITLPCRGFAAAVAAVDGGGEVIVLDSAGYGPFNVTKSVSIIAPEGIYAGITSSTGTGIGVFPGAADKVVLRGLTVNGQGGATGINIVSGAELHIERCTVANMNGTGIQITGGNSIHISDSEIRGNGSTGILVYGNLTEVFVRNTRIIENRSVGVQVLTESRAHLDRVEISNNLFGGLEGGQLDPGKTVRIWLRESSIVGNGGSAFTLDPTNTNTAAYGFIEHSTIVGNAGVVGINTNSVGKGLLVVDRSVVSENSYDGIFASGTNAIILLRDSVVTRNGLRGLFEQLGGIVYSCGNNFVGWNVSGPGISQPATCNQ